MIFTTIYHPLRKRLGLTCNEYCVADSILVLSSNPYGIPGWCTMGRGKLAEELDLSRITVIKIIRRLVELGYTEVNEKDHMRPSRLFYEGVTGAKEDRLIELRGGVKKPYTPTDETEGGVKKVYTQNEQFEGGCKESIHPTQIEGGVKKLDTGCKESLQVGVKKLDTEGVKKLDTIENTTIDIDKESNKEKSATAKNAIALVEAVILTVLTEEVVTDSKKEKGQEAAPGGQSPESVPTVPNTALVLIPLDEAPTTPPSAKSKKKIGSGVRAIIDRLHPGHYWGVKEAVSANEVANKTRNLLSVSNKATDDLSVLHSVEALIQRSEKLDAYYQFTDICALNAKFNSIVTQLQKTKNGQTANGRPRRQTDTEFASEIDRHLARRYHNSTNDGEERGGEGDSF